MTTELFRSDSYLQHCTAQITDHFDHGVVLDQTVFYPVGGGQPGDQGRLVDENGTVYSVIDTHKDRDSGLHVHVLDPDSPLPAVGSVVTAEIDWERRYKLMRMHSALHILCAKVDGAVTGGSIGTEKGRLDFDIAESPDKDALAAAINSEITANHPLEIGAISDEELTAKPELIKTMSVKPPMGQGSVRTIRVGSVDYQPCGGTHVKNTQEIGPIRIGKIEKKGKLNRRINIHFEG